MWGPNHIGQQPTRGTRAVAALPVVVDGVPRILICLGTRAQVGLGDRWFESLGPLFGGWNATDDEVRRRLALMRTPVVAKPSPPMFSATDLADSARDLADLSSNLDDELLRAKVEALRSRSPPGRRLNDTHSLRRSFDPAKSTCSKRWHEG